MQMKKISVASIDDETQNNVDLMSRLGDEFDFHPHVSSDQLLSTMASRPVDVFVIDVHMPIEDGFSVAKKIMRSPHYNGEPLLFVTFDQSLPVIRRCLAEAGADYVNREATSVELKGRLLKLVENKSSDVLKLGGLELNPKMVEARLHGEPLDLTLKEFKILSFLLTRNDHCIHRDYLQRHVWPDTIVSDKTLNSHFSNLRVKLADGNINVQVDRQGLVELSLKAP